MPANVLLLQIPRRYGIWRLLDREKEMLVQRAILRLNDKHKTVVILKYYQQLSYKEIAFMLKITEQKVRSRLYDARVQQKQILEQTTYF